MLNLKQVLFLIILSNIFMKVLCNIPEWTWSYCKKITQEDIKKLTDKTKIIYSKEKVPNFNQLIFSWNALRPKKGYFSFSVQPHYGIENKWGDWYKMADWGADIQKSYFIQNGNVSFIHVRLEIPQEKLADGFRLKIEAKDGADLEDLKLLSVCISDFSKFSSENISEIRLLKSVNIDGITKKSQFLLKHEHNNKMCSPTSTWMLVDFLSNKTINPLNFATNVYDYGLEAYGSWPFNTAHAFEQCPNSYFRVIRLNSFKHLHSYIDKGTPVVVSVRGNLNGAPLVYNKGHLILITGWDKQRKQIICHDPAFAKNSLVKHRYDIKSFLRAWERSNRLAYIVDSK